MHGGTTKQHIIEKVRQAESLAESNCRKHGKHIITVLFFDEANTTEAVGCIKEIMCDGTIDGQPLALNTNLKLVAACNPYRKYVWLWKEIIVLLSCTNACILKHRHFLINSVYLQTFGRYD